MVETTAVTSQVESRDAQENSDRKGASKKKEEVVNDHRYVVLI